MYPKITGYGLSITGDAAIIVGIAIGVAVIVYARYRA